MEHGSVFKSNRSQAVRLPKAMAWPEDVKRVDIVALGRSRVIAPAGALWDSWFEEEAVSADYMSQRGYPEGQTREAF